MTNTVVTMSSDCTLKGMTAKAATFATSLTRLLVCTNSFVLRFAASTVTQHDLSLAIVSCSLAGLEELSHIEHIDRLATLAIGHDATTSGNPMLNTKKIAASVNARVRYFENRFMLPF